MEQTFVLEMLPQPDDVTCGPTCLHAMYAFHGDTVPLAEVIDSVDMVETGGTLAVLLGVDALRRGYSATIYTYNLKVFDPTWLSEGSDLSACLRAQAMYKSDERLRSSTKAYLEYMRLGGVMRHEVLDAALIRRHLKRGQPILVGLSATYLYGCAREYEDDYDDLRGSPQGHFVVIYGYDSEHRSVNIADPLQDNPAFDSHHYEVDMDRLLGAILLGVVTYDADLLILSRQDPNNPRKRKR